MDHTIIITGTTASGKTSLAEDLCRYLRSEIISADARCFYRGIEIGNGKFTMDRSIPYNLIDVCRPNEYFSVRRYIEAANETIRRIHKDAKAPIVCGGSMLHIERIVKGMGEGPNPDHHLREWLDDHIQEFGTIDAHEMLREIDPTSAMSINPKDSRRIRRALEIRLSCLPKVRSIPPLEGNIHGYFMDRPDDVLQRRIRDRTESMVGSGWIEEVRSVSVKYNDAHIPGLDIIGIQHVHDFISGKCDQRTLIDSVVRDTMDLARSQRKWLGRLSFQRIVLEEEDLRSLREKILEKLHQHEE